MDYVVTWFCEHIAQVKVKRRLEEISRARELASLESEAVNENTNKHHT